MDWVGIACMLGFFLFCTLLYLPFVKLFSYLYAKHEEKKLRRMKKKLYKTAKNLKWDDWHK